MNKMTVLVIVLACLLLAIVPAQARLAEDAAPVRAPSATGGPPSTATFTVDGVELELVTSFLANPAFVSSDPSSAIQTASAVERTPVFKAFSVTAAPFGTSPPTESVPVAAPGGAGAYRRALRAFREEQGGRPEEGATMRLFGEEVVGLRSVVPLTIRDGDPVPVAITEWVVEAGPRLWIVRASREVGSETRGVETTSELSAGFWDTALRSPDAGRPSTSLAAGEQEPSLPTREGALSAAASDLPFPSWWQGECDTDYFHAETDVDAYPLGAEYRGLKACGPRPWWDGGPWAWVNFGEGIDEIEWQCPELSMRFLYLAYGIAPYPANGNQVVENYSGDQLEKVWNCTGRAPQPDDVLSYGFATSVGHTSVVVDSDVDGSGDGTIQVIEQNGSPTGDNALAVEDWCVVGYTDIGWLHEPDWFVTYYGDDSLGTRCATGGRDVMYLFETWGEDAPSAGCPIDNFSAHFSRSIEFPGGDYTFALGYDEGARLKIDGETVVDGWGTEDCRYETVHLDAGRHQVSVETYDRYGEAALSVFWWGPGFELSRETREDAQWYAEYWGNASLWWDPVVTVREGSAALSLDWSSNGPAEGLPHDGFSSRFRRAVSFEDAGRWRFRLSGDDGARLWIDDQLIVDAWGSPSTWFTPTVTLDAGEHELKVEHYDNEGAASIDLDWPHVSDVITPTAWITSPVEGATIDACPITIESDVDDDLGSVDRVEFHAYYDQSWHHLGDDDAAPYSWDWDCQSVVARSARLAVHVWDEAGNEFVDLGSSVSVTLDHLERVHLPVVLRGHSSVP